MTDAPRARPLSPHAMHWRWHITMVASILNRVTGVGLYGGLLLFTLWALALASGLQAYGVYESLARSPLGYLALIPLTFSLLYHMAAGVRHLLFDAGVGFDVKSATLSSWLCLLFALGGTVLVWICVFARGGL
jgi:succinate dehydrogenase / fumarate reductase, cytochrome b subunit